MDYQARTKALFSILSTTLVLVFSANASASVDIEAANTLAHQNSCFKCHAVVKGKKAKDGPAWNKVAEKYRGQADAEERLIHHLTSGENAKFPDGVQEYHRIIKAKDSGEIKNLVDWIISL